MLSAGLKTMKLLAISLLTMAALSGTAAAADPHSYAETDKFLVQHVDLDCVPISLPIVSKARPR